MKSRIPFGVAASRPWLVVGMAFWLAVSPACWASEAEAAALPDAPQPQAQAVAASADQPQALQITILDGEGALNNIRQRTAREPIVQVKDRNHKPVAGVLVVFAINDGSSGAGASVGGASTFSVVTDADGRAQIHGFSPNGVAGNFTITVTATLGAVVSTAIIHQENRPGTASSGQSASNGVSHSKFHIIPKSSFFKVLIAGGIVGGTVAVVVGLTSNSGPQITAGAGTVTHP